MKNIGFLVLIGALSTGSIRDYLNPDPAHAKRSAVWQSLLAQAEGIARATQDPEAEAVIRFLHKGIVRSPLSANPLQPTANSPPLHVFVLLKSETESVRLKEVTKHVAESWISQGIAGLVIQEDRLSNGTEQGFALLNDGRRLQEALVIGSGFAPRSAKPSDYAKMRLAGLSLDCRLRELYFGACYQELLALEISRFAWALRARERSRAEGVEGPIRYPKLDQFFGGPAATQKQSQARANLFWAGAVLKMLAQTGSKEEVTARQLEFVMVLTNPDYAEHAQLEQQASCSRSR